MSDTIGALADALGNDDYQCCIAHDDIVYDRPHIAEVAINRLTAEGLSIVKTADWERAQRVEALRDELDRALGDAADLGVIGARAPREALETP